METKQTEEVYTCVATGYESTDRNEFTEHKGELYYDDYFNEHFEESDHDNEYYPVDQMVDARDYHGDNIRITKTQRDVLFFRCADTGDYFYESDSTYVQNVGRISDYAYSNGSYSTCEVCGDAFRDDDTYWNERQDRYECSGCQTSSSESNIQDDGEPNLYPKLGNGPVFYGIELEVENRSGDDTDEKAGSSLQLLNSITNFAICKGDGSLSDGFEIVSCPASMDQHKNHWDEFLSRTPGGLNSHNTSTCGMHIHVSREPLTTLQIAKIMLFLHHPKNRDYVTAIAQRGSGSYTSFVDGKKAKYAKVRHKVNNRDGTSFERYSSWHRYEALNLSNDHTIEFRLFRGNLRKDRFFKNLEFAHALVNFCDYSNSGVRLAEAVKHEVFSKYVEQNKEAYPYLYEYLVEKQLMTDNPKTGDEYVPGDC